MGFTGRKIELEICQSLDHLWKVTRFAVVSCGSHDLDNYDYGAAVDSFVLLQLQKVVSWLVAALVNIDAGCTSNLKCCFILGERRWFTWQYIFSHCIKFSSGC